MGEDEDCRPTDDETGAAETAYLLSTPANAAYLREGLSQAWSGEAQWYELLP